MIALLQRICRRPSQRWHLAWLFSFLTVVGLSGCGGCSTLPPPQQAPEQFLNQLRALEEQAQGEARQRLPVRTGP